MASLGLSMVAIFMLFIINFMAGITANFPEHSRTKRSDGLVRDIVHQMVAEQQERKTILAKFRKMENQLDDVKRELKERNTLLHDTKFLQKKLEGSVGDFKKEIREASRDDVKKAIDRFRENMSAMSKGLDGRISRVSQKNSQQMKLLQNEVLILKYQVANHTRSAHGAVAFSAKLNRHFKTSSAVVFEKVITNVGGGYRNSSGVFFCPKDGIYMFSVTLKAYSRSSVEGYIMKNDVQLGVLTSGVNGPSYPSASLTLIMQLKTGDRVWVKGLGYKYYDYSYFSGSLVSL